MKSFVLKKPFFLTVACLSTAAMILRLILLATGIDPATGFYYNRMGFTRLLFIAVFVLAAAFGMLFLYLSKKRAILPMNLKFDLSPIFSEKLLFAGLTIGFAVNTFYEIYRLANPEPSITLPQSAMLFGIITTIFSVLSLIYFLCLTFFTENVQVGSSLFCVVPILWCVFRIMRDFVCFSTIVFISENLLDIIYLCFLLVALISASRILTGTEQTKGYRIFTVISPITIALGLGISVPAIIGFLCGFYTLSGSDMFMHFVSLTLSIYFMRIGMYIFNEK